MIKHKRLLIFAGVVLLQVVGLFALENELTPAQATASYGKATASAQNQTPIQTQPKLHPPEDAVLCDIDPHGDALAYLNRHDQVVVQTQNGPTTVNHLEGVQDLQWLDNGMTLFYERDNYGQNEIGVLQVQEDNLVPLYDIPGDNVQIEKVFEDTYSQSIQMLYQADGQYALASYEQITGFRSTPLDGIEPTDGWFDQKEEVTYIKDTYGTIWRYQDGRLLGDSQQGASQQGTSQQGSPQQGASPQDASQQDQTTPSQQSPTNP